MGENHSEQTVALLRSQRHSFMNHLQVISGWLQLGRPDRARQYLESIASRMSGEGEAVRQVSSSTALAIMTLGLEAETYGVHLDWRVRKPAPSYGDEALEGLMARVREAFELVSALPEAERRVQVDLGERIDLHMLR